MSGMTTRTTSYAAVVCRRCGAESPNETAWTGEVISRLWEWLETHYDTCAGTLRDQ